MANTAATLPGTASQSGATNVWDDPDQIKAQNDTGCYAARTTDANSAVLIGSNYGFTIPTAATIKGIVVTIRRYHTASTSPMPIDVTVQLRKAGVAAGDNLSAGASFPAAWEDKVFGSSTNMWGTTWTAAEINNSGFGIGYQLYRYTTVSGDPYVDSIKITVYYTIPGGQSALFGGGVTIL
jgi:hypothetical protein